MIKQISFVAVFALAACAVLAQDYHAPAYGGAEVGYDAPSPAAYNGPTGTPTYNGEAPAEGGPESPPTEGPSGGYGGRRHADAYYTPYNFAGHYAAAYKPRPNDYIPRSRPNPKHNRQPPRSIVMYQGYVPSYGSEEPAYAAYGAHDSTPVAPVETPEVAPVAPAEEAPSSPMMPMTSAPATGTKSPGYSADAPVPVPEATSEEAPDVLPPAEDTFGEAPPAGEVPSVVPEDPEPAPVGYGPPESAKARYGGRGRRGGYGRRRGSDSYFTPYNFAGHYAASYKPRPNDHIPKTRPNPKHNRQAPRSIVMYQSYVPSYGDAPLAPVYAAPSTGAYGSHDSSPATPVTPVETPDVEPVAPAPSAPSAPSAPAPAVGGYGYQASVGYGGSRPAYQAPTGYSPPTGYGAPSQRNQYLIPHYTPTTKTHTKYQPYLYAKPHPKYSEQGSPSAGSGYGYY